MSVKISQMPAAPSVTGSDLIPIVQAGLNKTATPAAFMGSQLFTRNAVGAQAIAINTFFTNCPFVSLNEFVIGSPTDYQPALQAAVNYCVLTGVPLYLPPGNFNCGSQVNINGSLTVFGAGDNVSFIVATSTTQSLFVVNTDNTQVWRDFALAGQSNATAGSLVFLTSSVSQNLYSSFVNIRFQNGWDQFVTQRAAAWRCEFCKFFSPVDAGMTVENDFNVDGGDMGCSQCIFIGGGVGTAVTQFSAGGMRFHGCKVINWANGYVVNLVTGVHTGDLFINGCSFESFVTTAIAIQKGAGITFAAIHINDNEISVCTTGILTSPDTGPWTATLNINDNQIEFGDTLRPGLAGTGISLAGFMQVNIHDNQILTHNGLGTGLAIGTVPTQLQIHNNTFNAMTNTITGYIPGSNGAVTNRKIIIKDNIGFNPIGFVAMAPTASPWTYTNGSSPADVCLSAATNITDVTINGNSCIASAVGAGINVFIHLEPNDVMVATYSGAMNTKQIVH